MNRFLEVLKNCVFGFAVLGIAWVVLFIAEWCFGLASGLAGLMITVWWVLLLLVVGVALFTRSAKAVLWTVVGIILVGILSWCGAEVCYGLRWVIGHTFTPFGAIFALVLFIYLSIKWPGKNAESAAAKEAEAS